MVFGSRCCIVTVIPIKIRKRSTPLLDNPDSNTSVFFEMPTELIPIVDPQFLTNPCWNIRLVPRHRAFSVYWVTHG
ncbi:hypothetical protein ABY42_10595 [Haloferax gibbonsii]|uniref:Uncharacterized protein n=1 Tax=Haloferax gibbonsii TaxID=35746 RepID=A0A0K1IUD7_HALGI|nr:hypothetical protein ABY42_10595 [Haloferax gibbonsii]